MKRYKVILIILSIFILGFIIQFPLVWLFENFSESSVRDHDRMGFVWLGVFISIIIFSNYKNVTSFILKLISSIIIHRGNIVIISISSLIPILIVIISYSRYVKNPQDSYVLSDEILKKHNSILKKEHLNELKIIQQYVHDKRSKESRWILLDSLIRSAKNKGFSSNDLMISDTLILSFEGEHGPPGSEPTFKINAYDKSGSYKFTEFCTGQYFDDAFKEKLNEVRLSTIKSLTKLNIASESLKDYRWSFLSFLSYYLKDQLQPMTTSLRLLDFLFSLFKWIFLGVITWIASSIPEKITTFFKKDRIE